MFSVLSTDSLLDGDSVGALTAGSLRTEERKDTASLQNGANQQRVISLPGT